MSVCQELPYYGVLICAITFFGLFALYEVVCQMFNPFGEDASDFDLKEYVLSMPVTYIHT